MRKTGSREEPEWQEITSFLMGHNVWENGTIIFISARIHCHPVYLLKRRTQLLLTVRVNQSILCRTASGKLAFSLLHRAALGLWLLSQSSIRCSVTSLALHGESHVYWGHREEQSLWLVLRDLPKTEYVALADPLTTLGGRSSDHRLSDSASNERR